MDKKQENTSKVSDSESITGNISIKGDENTKGPSRGVKKIDTGGGAYIGGNVNTGGGDFVGRDRSVSVNVGGNVSGSNIVIGNSNMVTVGVDAQNVFAPIYQAIEKSSYPTQEKTDLRAEIQEIEAAVAPNKPVDESWLSRRLRNLKKMAPDIADVALAALGGPGTAVAVVVKQVAAKVRAE